MHSSGKFAANIQRVSDIYDKAVQEINYNK